MITNELQTKAYEFDTDCAVDDSRVSLRRWLKYNTDGRFRPDFAVVKPVPPRNCRTSGGIYKKTQIGDGFPQLCHGVSLAKPMIPLVLLLPTGFEAGFACKVVFHPAIVITDVTVKNHVIA